MKRRKFLGFLSATPLAGLAVETDTQPKRQFTEGGIKRVWDAAHNTRPSETPLMAKPAREVTIYQTEFGTVKVIPPWAARYKK